MEYILVLILSIAGTAKMSFQSAFGKKNVVNSTDALCFNIFVFITVSVIFIPKVIGCSEMVWTYAVISGIFAVCYQIFYTIALSIGNVSLTVLIVNFGMVINVLVSYLFFNDSISLVRLTGIIMTVVSFIICSENVNKESTARKWFIFAVLALFANSFAAISQKIFGESPYASENQAYISCLYMVSLLIGVVIYNIMNKKEKRTFKIDFNMIKYAILVGVCLAVYQLVFTYSLAHVEGTFLFPAQTGGLIILSTLSGVLIFKDKFTKKQLFGVILGIVSLILMNY